MEDNDYLIQYINLDELNAEEKEEFESKINNIINSLKYNEISERDFCDELEDLGFVLDDGVIGYDYDPVEANCLCAIQQKFRELVK